MNFILFPTKEKADLWEDDAWSEYLSSQPSEIKQGTTLYGYRDGQVVKDIVTTKYYDVQVASDDKAFVGPVDSSTNLEKVSLYEGEVKTLQWMITNGYIEET